MGSLVVGKGLSEKVKLCIDDGSAAAGGRSTYSNFLFGGISNTNHVRGVKIGNFIYFMASERADGTTKNLRLRKINLTTQEITAISGNLYYDNNDIPRGKQNYNGTATIMGNANTLPYIYIAANCAGSQANDNFGQFVTRFNVETETFPDGIWSVNNQLWTNNPTGAAFSDSKFWFDSFDGNNIIGGEIVGDYMLSLIHI